MGWIEILLHKLKGENVVLRGQDFDLLVNFSLAQELNWRQLWSAVLHRSKPYQVRRAGNTKCSSSFFWAWPHTIYKCFLNRSASLNSFSLFFLPSHHMCPFMTDSLLRPDSGHNEVTRLWCCGEYLQLHLNNSCFLLKWFEKFNL